MSFFFWQAKNQAFFSLLSHRKLFSLFPSAFNSLLNSVFYQNMRLKLYHVVCPTHGLCVLVGCIHFLIFVSGEYPLCPKVLYVFFAYCVVTCIMSLSSYSFSPGFEGIQLFLCNIIICVLTVFSTHHLWQLLSVLLLFVMKSLILIAYFSQENRFIMQPVFSKQNAQGS